jgi:hypothetical protein
VDPVYTRKLEQLLGPARQLDTPLAPRHEAVTASLQVVFETGGQSLAMLQCKRCCTLTRLSSSALPAAAAFIQVRGGHDL